MQKLNDIPLFCGWVILNKRRKKFTIRDLDIWLQTGCWFRKKPSKKILREALFDPKTERVSKVTMTLVNKGST
jgi:hypothetical protein